VWRYQRESGCEGVDREEEDERSNNGKVESKSQVEELGGKGNEGYEQRV